MQTIKEKMIPAFRDANGGLFQAVEKADVGSAYQDLEKQGVALMGWADPFMPDRSLPEPVAAAWLDAVRAESAPHYTAPIGDPALKAALAKKLKQQNGLTVDPERNILITPGSDSGLYFAILPFVGQGDEVLIPSPSYPNNFLDVKIMGGVPVAVELEAEPRTAGSQIYYPHPHGAADPPQQPHHHHLQPCLAAGAGRFCAGARPDPCCGSGF